MPAHALWCEQALSGEVKTRMTMDKACCFKTMLAIAGPVFPFCHIASKAPDISQKSACICSHP